MQRIVQPNSSCIFAGIHTAFYLVLFGQVEIGRGFIELVKRKYKNADQQHTKLQRHFYKAIHQQSQLAFTIGACRQESTHLALIGAKITESEEQSTNNTAEQVILVFPVETTFTKAGSDNVHFTAFT